MYCMNSDFIFMVNIIENGMVYMVMVIGCLVCCDIEICKFFIVINGFEMLVLEDFFGFMFNGLINNF